MTHLRLRMLADMQLRGLAPKTQESYLRAVRQLAEYYAKSPDQISEAELRDYFLYLKNEKHASRSACTIALCGIKFFYEHTLQRQWAAFDLVRPPKSRKLPVVLTQTEVRQLLGCVRRLPYRVCLTTIYSCGLRLSEALRLEVGDVDGERELLHIRQAKGGEGSLCALAPAHACAAATAVDQSPPYHLSLPVSFSLPTFPGNKAIGSYQCTKGVQSCPG